MEYRSTISSNIFRVFLCQLLSIQSQHSWHLTASNSLEQKRFGRQGKTGQKHMKSAIDRTVILFLLVSVFAGSQAGPSQQALLSLTFVQIDSTIFIYIFV